MQYWLLVFIGGGLGSVCRYGLGEVLLKDYPIGTWLANIVGCLIIGILISLTTKNTISPTIYALLAIGFCGGFTTFSSFSAENVSYILEGEWIKFAMYFLLTIIPGFLFVIVGLRLGNLIN